MRSSFVKTKLEKAVILSGELDGPTINPFASYGPIITLPVFNTPLIEQTIKELTAQGIKKIAVTSSASGRKALSECLDAVRRKYPASIELVEEQGPMGTAGVLRDLKHFIGDDQFLLVSGTVYLHDFDFDTVYAEHVLKKSALTVIVKQLKCPAAAKVSMDPDGTVTGFSHAPHSGKDLSSMISTGMFIFDPAALEFVSKKGYFDLKEQLVPALKEAHMPVHASQANGYCKQVLSAEDYFDLHREGLLHGYFDKKDLLEIAEGVWAGKGVQIPPSAYIHGPVLIGDNCRIEKHAQLIGPAVLGEDCVIGEGAFVRESVIWKGLKMGSGSKISYSITGSSLSLSGGTSVQDKIVIERIRPVDMWILFGEPERKGVVDTADLRRRELNHLLSSSLKRLTDISISLLCLTVFSPVMLILAALVKFDSEGPVLFRQERCGRDGKNFMMLKFRTMVKDAHAMQHALAGFNKMDGPMFKIEGDPRVTRLGRFLRSTSLDELPQLFNVLMGDMSLVGPRPLVMKEMSFSPSWRTIRLKVKPGITGLWQVNGRSDAMFHDWIRYDINYVRNQSFWFDIKILFKTILVVLKKVGAC